MINLTVNKDILFRFITILFFFLPSSVLLGGPSVWFLIIFSIAAVSFVLGYEKLISAHIKYFILFFLFSLIMTTISITRSYQYIIADDLLELLRIASLLIFLLCGYFLSSINTRDFLLKFFMYFLLFQFFIVIFQKIEFLKSIMSIIWNMDKAWALRGTGTLGNPNVLALMSIFALLFIYFFSDRKKVIFLAFFVCSLNVLLSGSRTGLVGYFVVIMFVLFISGRMSLFSIIKKLIIVFIFASTTIAILVAVAGELRYMGELLNAFNNGNIDLTKVGTFNHRVEAWQRQFTLFDNSGDTSIFVGMGPAKGAGFRVMDNDYMAQYLKYGVIGVLSNIILLMMLFFSTLSCRLVYSNAAKFMSAVILSYLIFALTAATFLSLFNMIPLMMVAGFLIKAGFKRNEYSEKNNNHLPSSSV